MKDTLIGVVKNSAQHNFCLTNHIYYTYEKVLTCPPEQVKYVAFYKPRSSFSPAAAGISRYAKVTGFKRVKRGEIAFAGNPAHASEDCLVFILDRWIDLLEPISPIGEVKILMLTPFDVFLKAKVYQDLYFKEQK